MVFGFRRKSSKAANGAAAQEQPTQLPKPAAQVMIENAVAALLPHAASNFMLPHNTPIRWHESYMQGSYLPFGFALWVCLDPEAKRTFTLDRTLPADKDGSDRLWGCSVTEPASPEDGSASFSVTSVGVRKSGRVNVQRVLYKKNPEYPDYYGTCVGGEHDFGLSSERRAELIGHISTVLAEATVQAPIEQAAFFDAANLDLQARSFDTLGSAATKHALGPIYAPVVPA